MLAVEEKGAEELYYERERGTLCQMTTKMYWMKMDYQNNNPRN
jgi:hypothetical protein